MAQSKPNVLFLLSDEHSFRYLGTVPEPNGEPVNTDRLDSLAKFGTRFEQAYCSVPLCTPSRFCLLTGREPIRCGAWTNRSVLHPNLPTFPATFGRNGYETCLIGKMHLTGNRQFAGFSHRPYGDLTGKTGHQWEPLGPDQRGGRELRSRTADAGVTEIPESMLQEYNVIRESISFLREHSYANPDQPWLLCASFTRPHFPLTAPARYIDRYWPDRVTSPKVEAEDGTERHPVSRAMARELRIDAIDEKELLKARAAYAASVDFLDDVIADLLETLERDGLLDNTIIVYASDHGELVGEHGLWWKQSWHEAATRVPWIVSTPSHRDGAVENQNISTPVSLTDLFPTLCGLVDIPTPDDLDGTDLSTAVRKSTEPARDPVVCDYLIPRWGDGYEFRLIRDGKYKYVHFRDAPNLLFNLESDPFEQRNLVMDADEDDEEALNRLSSRVEAQIDFAEAETKRRQDEQKKGEYIKDVPRFVGGSGNAYFLGDGRLVDADVALYGPSVLTEQPAKVFADWPDHTEE